jgi:hypothetical protein
VEDRFDIELAVRTAARSAHRAPVDEDRADWGSPSVSGALLVVAVRTNRVAVGWVGDTRCYLVRDGVGEILGGSAIPEGTASPLGAEPSVVVAPVSAGDVLVLPSVGIRATIADPEEIVRIIADCRSLDEACESLIVAARLRGSQDTNFVVMLGVGLEHGPIRAVDPERNPLPFLMMIRASEVIPTAAKPKELPAGESLPTEEPVLAPTSREPAGGSPPAVLPEWLETPDSSSQDLATPSPPLADVGGARPEPNGMRAMERSARLVPSGGTRRSRALRASPRVSAVVRTGTILLLMVGAIGAAVWWWPRASSTRAWRPIGGNTNVADVADVSNVADQQPAPAKGDTYTVGLRVDGDFLSVSLGADAPGSLELRVQRLILGRWENIGTSTLDPGKRMPVFLAAGSESAAPTEGFEGTLAFQRSSAGEIAWAPTSSLGSLPPGAAVSIENGKVYVAYRSRDLLLILRAM